MEENGAPELRATYSDASDVQHVAEELAVHSVISEERHEEILEESERCLLRLDQLSTEQKTENESLRTAIAAELTAIAAQLKAMRLELENLKQSRATQSSLLSSGSTEANPPTPPPSEGDGRPEVRTENPELA